MTQQIGRYSIGKMIGAGGMATVYEAYDNNFNRTVAIKMLDQHALFDDEARAKFEQEVQVVARLEHHAIVPIYDAGEHENRPYLVMRYMTGGTLKERLNLNPMSLEEIGGILKRICSALDRAHSQKIVHRDIKPSNILFDEVPVAYLGDFGIARDIGKTQTATVIGSPRYMAPEQARGEDLSPSTDVYQVGAVLFHMLTGRVPFDAETTESILYQHVYKDVPLLLEQNPKLPPRLEGLIGYAMAKEPAERFQSAGQLSAEFDQIIGRATYIAPPIHEPDQRQNVPEVVLDMPTETIAPDIPSPEPETILSRSEPETIVGQTGQQAPPPPVADDLPKPAVPTRNRRNTMLIVAGTIFAVAILICGAALLYGVRTLGLFTEATQEPQIIIPTSPATPQPEEDGSQETDPPAPTAETPELAPTATLPSESDELLLVDSQTLIELGGGRGQIAYAAWDAGQFDIFLIDENGSERRLTTHSDDDFRPIWSPDGSRIAFHSLEDTWEIYTMAPDGSGKINLSRNPADDAFPQWSPDGSQIAFHSNRNDNQFDIYVMNADGSNVRRLTSSEDGDFAPAWSPDGQTIAFHRFTDSGRRIFFMNPDGTNERQIDTGNSEAIFPVWSPDGRQLSFHSNANDAWRIWVYTVADNNAKAVSTQDANPDFYATWSPNSQWVIFHSRIGDDNRELYMVNVNTLEIRRLTDSSREERMPAWRP